MRRQEYDTPFKAAAQRILISLVFILDIVAIVLQLASLFFVAQSMRLAKADLAQLTTSGITAIIVTGIVICLGSSFLRGGIIATLRSLLQSATPNTEGNAA